MRLPGWPKRRTPHIPQHAGLLAAPPAPATGPFPALTPNSGLTAEDFRRPATQADAADAYLAAGPDGDTALFVPDFAETGALERPYVPAGGAPGGPAVLLRAIALDGSGASVKEAVTGFPGFLGPREDGGTRYVGIGLGTDGDSAVVLDATSAEWLDELITSAQQARDALVYGGFRPVQAAAEGGAL
jgi:hypothetical protein